MKIRVTFDLNDSQRRAIANYFGHEGMADYKTCKDLLKALAESDVDVMCDPLDLEDDGR